MFFNKHFKKMLNILLLVVIFVSLACYYFVQCKSSMSIIEGKSPRKLKRRGRREKRRAKGRIRRLGRPMRNAKRLIKGKGRRRRRRRRRKRKPTTSLQSQRNTITTNRNKTTQATTKVRTARTQATVSKQKEAAAKQAAAKAAQEAAKKKAEEEAAKARKKAAEEATKRAVTERARVAAQRKAAEEKRKAEEAARRRAEAEKKKAGATRKAAEAARRRAEAEKKAAEEAARTEAARKAAEEEARRIAEAERARKAAQEAEQRRLEENKKTQEEIYNQLKTGVSGTNISNCAVSYNTNLQLGKNKGLFNIFGNNDILRCNKDGNPEFVPAKQEEINDKGFVIINQNKNNTSGLIMYGDTISLCGKNHVIGGKDSTEKVQYGDNISITSNETGKQFNATVNPNVYNLSNVKNLKSDDYTNYYVTNYEYCGNSGSGGGMSAQG